MEFIKVVPSGEFVGYDHFLKVATEYVLGKGKVLAGPCEYEYFKTHSHDSPLGLNIKRVFFCGTEFEYLGKESVAGFKRADNGVDWEEFSVDTDVDFYPEHVIAIVDQS